MTLDDKREIIKASVTLRDVIGAYGLEGANIKGRIPCPFHKGNNRDAFSFNDKLFQCWNCGVGGDQIKFVMLYEGLKYGSALNRINEFFHLWEEDRPLTFQEKMKIQKMKREREIEQKKRERAQRQREKTIDDVYRLDGAMIRYAPKRPEDEFDDRFVEACHWLGFAVYKATATVGSG